MRLSTIVLAMCLAAVGFQGTTEAAQPIEAQNNVVRAIDKAIIPAQEPGVLLTMETEVYNSQGQIITTRVKRGMVVLKDQILGQINDQLAQADVTISQRKLDVAKKEATNTVNKRFAEKSAAVALKIYEKSVASNEAFRGTIPDIELRRQYLDWEKAVLQIEQAAYDLDIAKDSQSVREAELEKALEIVERRKIKAPFNGIIVNVIGNAGEWVQPGDQVVELVGLERLYIEGRLKIEDVYPPGQVMDKLVTITIPQAEGTMQGRVVSVSPNVATGGYFDVQAEVANPRDAQGNWMLFPGMDVKMTIHN